MIDVFFDKERYKKMRRIFIILLLNVIFITPVIAENEIFYDPDFSSLKKDFLFSKEGNVEPPGNFTKALVGFHSEWMNENWIFPVSLFWKNDGDWDMNGAFLMINFKDTDRLSSKLYQLENVTLSLVTPVHSEKKTLYFLMQNVDSTDNSIGKWNLRKGKIQYNACPYMMLYFEHFYKTGGEYYFSLDGPNNMNNAYIISFNMDTRKYNVISKNANSYFDVAGSKLYYIKNQNTIIEYNLDNQKSSVIYKNLKDINRNHAIKCISENKFLIYHTDPDQDSKSPLLLDLKRKKEMRLDIPPIVKKTEIIEGKYFWIFSKEQFYVYDRKDMSLTGSFYYGRYNDVIVLKDKILSCTQPRGMKNNLNIKVYSFNIEDDLKVKFQREYNLKLWSNQNDQN